VDEWTETTDIGVAAEAFERGDEVEARDDTVEWLPLVNMRCWELDKSLRFRYRPLQHERFERHDIVVGSNGEPMAMGITLATWAENRRGDFAGIEYEDGLVYGSNSVKYEVGTITVCDGVPPAQMTDGSITLLKPVAVWQRVGADRKVNDT